MVWKTVKEIVMKIKISGPLTAFKCQGYNKCNDCTQAGRQSSISLDEIVTD